MNILAHEGAVVGVKSIYISKDRMLVKGEQTIYDIYVQL